MMLDRSHPSYETIQRCAAKDARYAALLQPEDRPAGYVEPKPAGRKALDCIHRGGPTGQTRPCKECTKTTAVSLFGCAKHGVCTESKLVKLEDGSPVKCCRICLDREEPHSGTA